MIRYFVNIEWLQFNGFLLGDPGDDKTRGLSRAKFYTYAGC